MKRAKRTKWCKIANGMSRMSAANERNGIKRNEESEANEMVKSS